MNDQNSQHTAIHQTSPFVVPTDDGKTIEEHFGLAAGTGDAISIARMVAPAHWSEPWQTPDFQEYTLVSRGKKQVELPNRTVILEAGQSVMVPAGVPVRYSNPFDDEVEYWAVCLPAFSPDTVHRES